MHLPLTLNKPPTNPQDSMKIINILQLFYCKLFKNHPIVVTFHVLSHLVLNLTAPCAICLPANPAAQQGALVVPSASHRVQWQLLLLPSLPRRAPGTGHPRPFPPWARETQQVPAKVQDSSQKFKGGSNPCISLASNFTTVTKRGQQVFIHGTSNAICVLKHSCHC